MKSLLNMAALSAKKSDTEIKAYYERKIAEGKNKMGVMNAIRFKIISRTFAVLEKKNTIRKHFKNLKRLLEKNNNFVCFLSKNALVGQQFSRKALYRREIGNFIIKDIA